MLYPAVACLGILCVSLNLPISYHIPSSKSSVETTDIHNGSEQTLGIRVSKEQKEEEMC